MNLVMVCSVHQMQCLYFHESDSSTHVRHILHTRGYYYTTICENVMCSSGVPRNFFLGGGGSTNSVEDRGQTERGSGGGISLVRGSGGSCNMVQEISFHIVKFS
jgi:hypothetical protein